MSTALNVLSVTLQTFKTYTHDPDVQVQAVQTFLIIAAQGNPGVNEIARQIGLSQPSASRNLRKLCDLPRGQEGYGLIAMKIDPVDHRKRVITLTARGRELARGIEEAMCRVFAPTLFDSPSNHSHSHNKYPPCVTQ